MSRGQIPKGGVNQKEALLCPSSQEAGGGRDYSISPLSEAARCPGADCALGGQGIKISSSKWMTLASHGQCACAVSQASQGQKAVGWLYGDKLSIVNTQILREMSCWGAGRPSVHS